MAMEKILIVDIEKCNGCRVCELVCSMARQGEYNPKESWIKLIRNREMDVNIVALDVRCDFCNQCVEWCFPKALKFVSWEEAAIIRKDNKIGKFPAPLLKGD
jgi:Fe-S-cluster-containing hydrogenase component 2